LYGNQWTFIITAVVLALGALTAFIGMPERAQSLLRETGTKHMSEANQSGISLLRVAIADQGVLLSLLSVLVVSIGFTVFRIYMTQYGSAGPAVFAGPLLVSVMAAASVGSAVPIGWLLDKTRRRTLFIAVGFLAEAVALGLIFLGPTPISLLLWSVVFGVAIMMVRVPQAVIIAERTVFGNRAGAMGTNHGVEHVGYGLGAFLGGVLVVSLNSPCCRRFGSSLLSPSALG
jgi:predicted MFS family arabinose efflux permease